jgi:glucosamine-6-phosphate deaminase
MDEWIKIGPRIVTLTPFTILQNCLLEDTGISGDWSSMPPKGATIGPKEYMDARLRSSWNGFMCGASQVSWQRFTMRLAITAKPTPLVPSTMLQMGPSELFINESLAADIKPSVVTDLAWHTDIKLLDYVSG